MNKKSASLRCLEGKQEIISQNPEIFLPSSLLSNNLLEKSFKFFLKGNFFLQKFYQFSVEFFQT